MLRKIYLELVAIREELQSIKKTMEPLISNYQVDGNIILRQIQKSEKERQMKI